ncbi:ATP-binding cassette ATPase Uup [Oceanisphaera pacifica]|uniref:ATP-binding protein Uup n=1 Tax=Oceanisphaera pacifica TaxID=2818389 RepID=A0ABS3NFX2_9GAMM|nr:ABC transporter ATP-binding protein [Oceanisphaera pacifica]MBO1519474.1 ABC transporter ATP-binding protein [Oceanisphaera pacifica]
MSLLTLQNAQLAFGDAPLLDGIELNIQAGERVCIVGRNGAGKSTLMKVIANELQLDDGRRQLQQGVNIARLEQDPPQVDDDQTVFDYVAGGLAETGALLAKYHHQLELVAHDCSEKVMNELMRLQEQVEVADGWQFETRINQSLTLLELDGDTRLNDLSGGWLRKVALARALTNEPEILLLDEPTNHLDIDAIAWLESFLLDFKGAIVFVSHDRAFIRKMATRIVDLDRGKLSSWPGNYDEYLVNKEEALRVESEQNALFDKRLAQEEAWIRQGVKARRTRNEGRVRALKALRVERSQRRESVGKVNVTLDDVRRSGKIVFEAENLNFAYENKPLLKNFSTLIQRGDKIALVGPNGCGKSTLIKLLLGRIEADSGTLKCGTKLEVAYFDQYREQLDPERTVMDNLAEGKQEVEVNGRSRHVLGYLQDFLFEPKRARTPVKALSGGEKNRLLLARLFLKPSNLLVLDEPTNDLDVETLELLEELLADYKGTLLLVSHDRDFIDNTATHCWLFEGEGKVSEFVGGYLDMQHQLSFQTPAPAAKPKANKAVAPAEPKAKPVVEANKATKKKLSYKEQQELNGLPAKLEQLEQAIEDLQATVNAPDFFTQSDEQTQSILQELANTEAEFEIAFTRWESLEEQS